MNHRSVGIVVVLSVHVLLIYTAPLIVYLYNIKYIARRKSPPAVAILLVVLPYLLHTDMMKLKTLYRCIQAHYYIIDIVDYIDAYEILFLYQCRTD